MAKKKRSKAKGCSQEQTKELATKEEEAPPAEVKTAKKKKKAKDAKDATTEKLPTVEKEVEKDKDKEKEKDKDKDKDKDKKDDKKDSEKPKDDKDKDKKKDKDDKTTKQKKGDHIESDTHTTMSPAKTTVAAVTAKTATTMKTTIEKVDKSVEQLDSVVDADIARVLICFPWYHGLMPRDEISDLLLDDGDFLVRKTDVGGRPKYATSVMNKGRIRHILFNYGEKKWWMKDLKNSNIYMVIQQHIDTKTPVQADGTLLVKGVHRPDFYILHDHIEVGKKLGGGAFGDVHVGKMKTGEKETTDVAVKKLKGAMNKKQRAEFMKEAKLMRRFDHPNIVRMIGVAAQEEPVMIILELAPGGCLKSKLKDNPDLSKEKLTDFVVGGCRGMCYLAARKVIHRDIAARNCLLSSKDEVKISDFGLSVADTSVLKLDKLKSMPIKWLAPETLRKGEFSTKSDVWSFGVMIWEIFAHCKTDPFPNMNNAEAKAKILSKEHPMTAPEGTPDLVKAVMLLCFTQDPDTRPDFEGLFKIIAPTEIPPMKPTDMALFETYAVPK